MSRALGTQAPSRRPGSLRRWPTKPAGLLDHCSYKQVFISLHIIMRAGWIPGGQGRIVTPPTTGPSEELSVSSTSALLMPRNPAQVGPVDGGFAGRQRR